MTQSTEMGIVLGLHIDAAHEKRTEVCQVGLDVPCAAGLSPKDSNDQKDSDRTHSSEENQCIDPQ